MLIYATDVKKFIHWYNGDRNVDMYYFDYPVIYSCCKSRCIVLCL